MLEDNMKESSFLVELEWILELRGKVLAVRSDIREARRRMRELQNSLSAAEDAPSQDLRGYYAYGTVSNEAGLKIEERSNLDDSLEKCQDARTALGQAIEECEATEDIQETNEFKLTRLEEHLYLQYSSQERSTWSDIYDSHEDDSIRPRIYLWLKPNFPKFHQIATHETGALPKFSSSKQQSMTEGLFCSNDAANI